MLSPALDAFIARKKKTANRMLKIKAMSRKNEEINWNTGARAEETAAPVFPIDTRALSSCLTSMGTSVKR